MARTRKSSVRNVQFFIRDLERRIAAGEGDASWQAKLSARLAALKGE